MGVELGLSLCDKLIVGQSSNQNLVPKKPNLLTYTQSTAPSNEYMWFSKSKPPGRLTDCLMHMWSILMPLIY